MRAPRCLLESYSLALNSQPLYVLNLGGDEFVPRYRGADVSRPSPRMFTIATRLPTESLRCTKMKRDAAGDGGPPAFEALLMEAIPERKR